MIITKENKYVYYSTIKKWIESCETIEQLDNVYKFVIKIIKKTSSNKGVYETIGYFSYFQDIRSLILNKRNNI